MTIKFTGNSKNFYATKVIMYGYKDDVKKFRDTLNEITKKNFIKKELQGQNTPGPKSIKMSTRYFDGSIDRSSERVGREFTKLLKDMDIKRCTQTNLFYDEAKFRNAVGGFTKRENKAPIICKCYANEPEMLLDKNYSVLTCSGNFIGASEEVKAEVRSWASPASMNCIFYDKLWHTDDDFSFGLNGLSAAEYNEKVTFLRSHMVTVEEDICDLK